MDKEYKHEYRQYVPPKGWSRFEGVDMSDPYRYSKMIVNSPQFRPLLSMWKANLSVPFSGVTSDGVKQDNLYHLRDEGAPTQAMVEAAVRLREALSPEERTAALRDLNSEDWRKWSNPEFVVFECGVRLEHMDPEKVDLILELVKQSLSESGFKKVRAAMKTNRFLGEICGRHAILNELSYFFTLFGEPSETDPWAYMLFGHHLCLNVSIIGKQMVVGPVFLGAEPCMIDDGPDKGIELCANEGELGLQLMRSLPLTLQQKAQTYGTMNDEAMPPQRWHPADERHLAGAFQDNRIIPYEGILVSDMPEEQQAIAMSIVATFSTLLPPEPLRFRLEHIRNFFQETYFSWIGGHGPNDTFYYRIQSPVALFEFDHHCGVFLMNKEPAKYHIHTIQRLPNGNDYGRKLIQLARGKGKGGER